VDPVFVRENADLDFRPAALVRRRDVRRRREGSAPPGLLGLYPPNFPAFAFVTNAVPVSTFFGTFLPFTAL
jgi:hypothetical protein